MMMKAKWLLAIVAIMGISISITSAQTGQAVSPKSQNTNAVPTLEKLLGAERAGLLLEERARYLNEEMAVLQEKQVVLDELERMIRSRLDELSTLEKQISALIQSEQELKQVRFDQLLKIYKNMKPAELKRVLWSLDPQTRLRVLERLQPKTIAQIIAMLDPEEAARVSESLLRVGGQN